ncbi:MAG: cyclic nucleotide-binding domain-containing protein [Bacteriovoracaceae bacterium]|nr:cyclic nucleotide-binding domain-containing protein [Bacteriovoracaceae bacterium]
MSTDTTKTQAKSGLRQLRPGEVLFNDGDVAESLYIIQKGQIRLYKPKGKGFIEIAVLRTGEVIGEMAFFDEDGSGKKRSASGAAMVPTEIIEISFLAFGKTMATLNPWFKTIINTLATRLRKANSRIKELESNSTSNYGAKVGEYEFIKPAEILKVLSTVFLVFKTHGEKHENGVSIHKKTLDLYSSDIYNLAEAKLEAILLTLKELGWLEMLEDADKLPHLYVMRNLELLKTLFIFYNTEKSLPDEKKLKVSNQCTTFLEKILQYAPKFPPIDIPNQRPRDEFDTSHRYTQQFNIAPILEEFKTRNLTINADHLDDARSVQLIGERSVEGKEIWVEIDMPKLKRMYPIIKFVNSVNRQNREKSNY